MTSMSNLMSQCKDNTKQHVNTDRCQKISYIMYMYLQELLFFNISNFQVLFTTLPTTRFHKPLDVVMSWYTTLYRISWYWRHIASYPYRNNSLSKECYWHHQQRMNDGWAVISVTFQLQADAFHRPFRHMWKSYKAFSFRGSTPGIHWGLSPQAQTPIIALRSP